jgi:crossover junction endodeoxyribonuclease RuvC
VDAGQAAVKVLGIDPSSTCTGYALLDDEDLIETYTWGPEKNRGAAWNLAQFYARTHRAAVRFKIEQGVNIAVIEFLTVSRNAKTTRVLSHYQAAAVIACKQAHMTVVEAGVRTARRLVLGNGGLAKEDAFAAVKKRYPDHKFKPKTRGGMDEADAVVLALAAEGLIEKR